jgi:hypothetical protein
VQYYLCGTAKKHEDLNAMVNTSAPNDLMMYLHAGNQSLAAQTYALVDNRGAYL